MAGDDTNDSAAQQLHLARVRDNQRRSRARRKEYLQELEEKYRRCEQQGIAASAEMQQAARRVLDENKRLKAALRQRGLSEEEVEVYARGLERENATSHLENMISATTLATSNAIVDQDDARLLSPVSTENSVGASSSRDLSHSPGVSHSSTNSGLNLIHSRGQFDPHRSYQPISPSSESRNSSISINTSLPPTLSSSSPSTSSANPTSYVNSFPPTPSSHANFPFNNNQRPNQHQQFPILPSNEPWSPPQAQMLQSTQQSVPSAANYPPCYQPLFPQHVQDRSGVSRYESSVGASGFPSQQGFVIPSPVDDRRPSIAGSGQQVWSQEEWQQQQQQQQRSPRPQQAQAQLQQRRPSKDFSRG